MGNFKEFVKETLPMIENITELLEKNNIDGCVTLTVDFDGYFKVSYGSYENGFDAIRGKGGDTVKIVSRTTEVL